MEAIIVFALIVVVAVLSAFATRSAHDRALRPDDPAIGSYGVTEPAVGSALAKPLSRVDDRPAGGLRTLRSLPVQVQAVDLEKAA
jgi:hypothetical protein